MANPLWCLPIVTTGPCPSDPLMIDANGHSGHPKIIKRITGNLERGDMNAVSGIIIHQTNAPTAQSTFNHYDHKNSNGAHFLIAKDGTIYQTASLFKMTAHVGRLRSLCVAQGKCDPVDPKKRNAAEELAYLKSLEWKTTALSKYESAKPAADRYPMNADSIGIELVGETVGKDPAHPKEALFVQVTAEQNVALTWLVGKLSERFGVHFDRVLRHPVVSRKTPSEAATANWQVGGS